MTEPAHGRNAAAERLLLARDSLADSRALARHGRRNAILLLDLALRQALSAIGHPLDLDAPGELALDTPGELALDTPDELALDVPGELALDAPGELALDTLLRRVPSDHPASALAARLADPRARDPDAVEHLIDSLSTRTAPEATRRGAEPREATRQGTRREGAARPDRATGGTASAAATAERAGSGAHPAARDDASPSEAKRTGAERVEAKRPKAKRPKAKQGEAKRAAPAAHTIDAAPAPAAGRLDDGPTAFEAAARREPESTRTGQTDPHEVASTAFWALADRWRLDDAEALALLGGGRALIARGTRPRFRLRGADARRHGQLLRIDTGLQAQGEPPDWLRRPRREAPFAGRTPLALMLDGAEATERVLLALNRTGLRAALEGDSRGRVDADR